MKSYVAATPAKPKQTLVPLRDDPFEFIFTAPIDEQMPVKTKSGTQIFKTSSCY